MNTFSQIKEEILNRENIVITSHVSPDGDAIGSGLALTLGLKKLGKKVRFILQDKYPDNVSFLKESNIAEIYNPDEKYDFDLAICVDSATNERLGKAQKLLENRFVINIDHHISNPSYGDLNHVEEISSTSELVYKFLKFCDIELDVNMAEALYTGLINDTGNFSHNNVTAKTFEMATELKALGVDNSKIVREFFNTRTMAAVKLLGKAMFDMKYEPDKKLVYYFMSRAELDKYNGRKEDTEGIVEKLISFKDAEVSLFLREDKLGVIKGSLRSKHNIDVNAIASLFNGGGHRKAAGFTTELSADEIVDIILKKL
ncbi:Bifunctional oligoribonuclease and PAP phosphatase nrnA [Fusobacterium necrogenes]|uniref:Bifunctional oligoribonuclease and PAP phosphatase nrnA n=1 Tax=Fusobacterium necrogenes TaxID=858 RepID=A0A377GXE4_9FUSO|nr:bifunctional oligoribonuclease/PAP phosphatase NrnA [Fusobacterium necrogenes]STO31629.1 Bifunctional oligoribonuclease and PAP phosphatase nrnA [Fusobacterium necrogenes]